MTTSRKPEALQPSDLAFVAIGVLVLLLGLGALAGVGAAAFLFGGGWVWPHGIRDAAAELAGLASGKPGHGLPLAQAHRLPGSGAVYTVVVLAEIAAAVTAAGLSRVLLSNRRTTDSRSGLATRADVAQALGGQCMTRRRAAEIRPDLYGKRSAP